MARQRNKPRRYLFVGICDECGDPIVDYRPRPRVRRHISPFVFCCRAHQLRHWRRRRSAAKQAAAVARPCGNPSCDHRIPPHVGPGRPALYCIDRCRRAADRARRRRRPMARSAVYLLLRFEMCARDYIDAKQERRGLMEHYGKTADLQAAFFEKNGGRAAVLESLQAGLAKVYAKHGGYARFGKHLPDAARGRAEQERAHWHDAIVRLRRILELEGEGGDAARLRRLDRAFQVYADKCCKLARDAANARARRARQQGADLLVGHDRRAAATAVETAPDVPTVLMEAVPSVDPNAVPAAGVGEAIEGLRARAAADPEYAAWAKARGLL